MAEIPKDNKAWAQYIASVQQRVSQDTSKSSSSDEPSAESISGSIDHTLLAETATEDQVHSLCAEALQYGFATVCVRLHHVAIAAKDLIGNDAHSTTGKPKVCCVVGFPSGEESTDAKTAEARKAAEAGAAELDMVINYPLLLKGEYTQVYEDVLAVRKSVPHPKVLKVILETSQLSEDQIVAAVVLSVSAGVDFVKTSTGFKGQGATVRNVEIMRAAVQAIGTPCRIKASGGIRSAENCKQMMRAGASRIGASAGVKIVEELKGKAVAGHGDANGY